MIPEMVPGTIFGKSCQAPFFSRVAPFAAFVALLAVQSVAGERWASALTLARPAVAAVLIAYFWRDYVELRGAPRTDAREWALAVVAGLAVFGAWITFDHGWAAFGAGAGGFEPLSDDGRIDVALAAARLAGLALVVPVMEELFWRSFAMRWIQQREFHSLDPRRVRAGALALSSALFASEHSLWFAGLLAGLVYGWLYVRSGNLRVSVLSHAITNATLGFWILAAGRWNLW